MNNIIPIQPINIESAEEQSISVSLARLDLMHPFYGGNKWFKLKYNLEDARSKGHKKILTFGGLDHDASEAVVVFGTDGKQIRRYKVATSWKTGFLPTASGERFGIYEHGYTRWNSVANFLDIDEGRPENFQRVRVIDMSTWDEIARLEWDPRSYSIKPAISPDGHRIARVRGGVLEVLQVN